MALGECHLPHQNIPALLEPHTRAHTNLKFRSFYSNIEAGILNYYATFLPGFDSFGFSVTKQPEQSPSPAAGRRFRETVLHMLTEASADTLTGRQAGR